MALITNSITRKFKMQLGGKEIELEDPNNSWSPDEILTFYSRTHPELTSATISGPQVIKDNAVYSFKTTLGTKG